MLFYMPMFNIFKTDVCEGQIPLLIKIYSMLYTMHLVCTCIYSINVSLQEEIHASFLINIIVCTVLWFYSPLLHHEIPLFIIVIN